MPAGFSGASALKIASYSTNIFYDVPYTINGSTISVNASAATQEANLGGGVEGFVYIKGGVSPLISVDSVLVAEYSAGRVSICPVLDNGVPDYTNNAAFITGLGGAEGSAIDPVTGDFLFSTFGGGNQVLVVTGFQQRCDLFFAGGGSCPLNYQPNPVTAISTCGSAGSPCATVCCQPKQPPPSGCVCDVLTVGSSCSRSTVQTSGRCLCMAFADAAPCEPTTSVQQPCP